MTFEFFTVVKTQVEIFWVVTLCSIVVGYHHLGGPCCLLHGEDGGSMVIQNFGILSHHNLEDLDRNKMF
jgi:hypothetical protein